MILPTGSGAKKRSWPRAAEWNVQARTPITSSASNRPRISPAALSVKVTARISSDRNAPVATSFATRCVIVVVLPEPAPARMQTGPRTASAARRCSGFNPSRIACSGTGPPYSGRRRALVRRLFRNRVFLRTPPRFIYAEPARMQDLAPIVCVRSCIRALLMQRLLRNGDFLREPDAPRLAHHRRQARDGLERLAPFDEPLELAELLLEPDAVDGRPARPVDLRVPRLGHDLVLTPQLLVQLLARADADELDRHLAVGLLAGEADHRSREVDDLHRLAHVEDEDLA